jgi:hypothetical protein
VTLAMLRASQGRRWQGRRTKANRQFVEDEDAASRCDLAVLSAANVAGRGTKEDDLATETNPLHRMVRRLQLPTGQCWKLRPGMG